MAPLAIAIVLFVVAVLLILLDVFVPSSGVLLAMAGVAVLGSIAFGFRHSFDAGTWLIIASFACVPFGFWLFVRIWPNTPIGRRMISQPPENQKWSWVGNPPGIELNTIVGKQGVVVSDLMPIGLVEIDKTQFEASCEGTLLERGTVVRVTGVNMGVLVVVELRDEPSALESGPNGDLLNESIESLGLESLEN